MKTGKSSLKYDRVLDLYARLSNGEVIHKAWAAEEYQVNARSVQRDIDALRNFLSTQAVKNGENREIIYDRQKKGFRLSVARTTSLSNPELYAAMKILLESRSLPKEEMERLLDKLLDACMSQAEKRRLESLLMNERFHYAGPRHNKKLVERIWELGGAVWEHKVLDLTYMRLDGEVTRKKVKPVGIMCSEYYFYMAGFAGDSDKGHPGFPTIYRIDRIHHYEILKERFSIPQKDRFEEGAFRKKIPFMYSGPLTRIQFIYRGLDINAVLDRLPSATSEKLADGSYKVKAQVYGKTGIQMWLGSQGNKVEIVDL